MDPKDVSVIISETYEYDRLHDKGELGLQIEIRWLIIWPWDGEIILY